MSTHVYAVGIVMLLLLAVPMLYVTYLSIRKDAHSPPPVRSESGTTDLDAGGERG